MKVYEVPLTFAEHHIDILGPDISCAFTGLLVLWFNIIQCILKVFRNFADIFFSSAFLALYEIFITKVLCFCCLHIQLADLLVSVIDTMYSNYTNPS